MLRNINEKLNGKYKLAKQGTVLRFRLMHGRILQLGSSENPCLPPISNCYHTARALEVSCCCPLPRLSLLFFRG